MSPEEVKHKVIAGYGPVIQKARELVAETRFGHATNDICIIAFIGDEEPNGEKVARLRGTTRDIAREVLTENVPELVKTIEMLSTPVAPDGFLLCIIDHNHSYVVEIDCLHETGGVLN
jgi:hypothetical protein